MTAVLEQLRSMIDAVPDTGSADTVRQYQPTNCTTDPSHVPAAINDQNFADLLSREVETARRSVHSAVDLAATFTVALGAELAELVLGRVSTEVDTNLGFDVDGFVSRAQNRIRLMPSVAFRRIVS